MKVPVVNRPEYIIYLEYFNDMYWLHTDVFKWSAKTKKHYIKDLDQLQLLIASELYALIENFNLKLGKFSEVIGFTYLKNLLGNDENVYKIYKRSLPWVA